MRRCSSGAGPSCQRCRHEALMHHVERRTTVCRLRPWSRRLRRDSGGRRLVRRRRPAASPPPSWPASAGDHDGPRDHRTGQEPSLCTLVGNRAIGLAGVDMPADHLRHRLRPVAPHPEAEGQHGPRVLGAASIAGHPGGGTNAAGQADGGSLRLERRVGEGAFARSKVCAGLLRP